MKVKKILSLLLIGIMVNTTVYSQIGGININKTKDKFKKKKEDTNASSSDSDISNSGIKTNDNSPPKYDSENPVYKAYSKVKENIKYTNSTFESIEWRSNIEGSNKKVKKYLALVQENMAFLKENGEDKKDYYIEFEQEHKKMEEFRSTEIKNYEIDQIYEKKMEAFYYWAKLQRPISDSTIEGSYTSYNKFKAEFESKRPKKYATSYMVKNVKAVDYYLNEEVYKEISYFDGQVDVLVKKGQKINERGEEYYLLNAKSLIRDYTELFTDIDYYNTYLLEKKDQINAVLDKYNSEKDMLDEYISSGKYDIHVAKYKQELIDAIRLRKPGMNGDKYKIMIKEGVDKGTVLRTVVASDRWMISRNDYGIPNHKYLSVDIAVNYDGKCWLAFGQIVRTYEGGGNYGAEYFSFWGIRDEMNCDNVNK